MSRCLTRLPVASLAFYVSVSLAGPGCVASRIVPSRDDIARLDRIEVVAMEPPPLIAPFAELGSELAPWGVLGPAYVFVAGGIVIADVINPPLDTPVSALNYQALVRDSSAWVPTMVLADSSGEILRLRGWTGATIHPSCVLIPSLDNRIATAHMENWYAPLRAWYNEDPDTSGRSMNGAPVDAVLQIGIINYEIYNEHLLVQVHMKLIDPVSGRVLGRTRKFAEEPVGDLSRLFVNDSEQFKQLFSSIGSRLVVESLDDLQLVSRSP